MSETLTHMGNYHVPAHAVEMGSEGSILEQTEALTNPGLLDALNDQQRRQAAELAVQLESQLPKDKIDQFRLIEGRTAVIDRWRREELSYLN